MRARACANEIMDVFGEGMLFAGALAGSAVLTRDACAHAVAALTPQRLPVVIMPYPSVDSELNAELTRTYRELTALRSAYNKALDQLDRRRTETLAKTKPLRAKAGTERYLRAMEKRRLDELLTHIRGIVGPSPSYLGVENELRALTDDINALAPADDPKRLELSRKLGEYTSRLARVCGAVAAYERFLKH